MMNYETATDFDLNKRLLELTCPHDTVITEIYQHRLAGKLKTFSHAMFKIEGCDDEFKVNYCTDWNATMPLAVEHGVGVSKYEVPTEDPEHGKWFSTFDNGDSSLDFYINDKSPLRAIVICLIRLLDSKQ